MRWLTLCRDTWTRRPPTWWLPRRRSKRRHQTADATFRWRSRRAKRRGRRYHLEAGQALTGLALAPGYDTALWWIAGIFAGGAVIGGALLRRGPLVQSAHRPRQTTG